MTEDQARLLAEVAARQAAIEQRLTSLEAAQEAALKQYDSSDAEYRKELTAYRERANSTSQAHNLVNVLRVVAFALLAYIAYRVTS